MFYVITSESCDWCTKAKEFLDSRDESYTLVPLEGKPYLVELLLNQNFNTVPQIFYGRHRIGGYEDLVKYLDH
jgi:glutaredoxin